MEENNISNDYENEQKQVARPIIIVSSILAVLVAVMVWFGIKEPAIFEDIRDLIIVLTVFVLIIVTGALAVLCFILNSKVDAAKAQLTPLLQNADGKIEEIAEKTADVIETLMNPLVEFKARRGSVWDMVSRKISEE